MVELVKPGLGAAGLAIIADAALASAADPALRVELMVSNTIVLLAVGVWLGIAAGLVARLLLAGARAIGRRRPGWSDPMPLVVLCTGLSGALLVPLGLHLFGGPRISQTLWGRVGPAALPIAGALACGGAVWTCLWLVRWADRAPVRARLAAAAGTAAVGVALMIARLHPLLAQQPVAVAACVAGACAAAMLATRLTWTPRPSSGATAGLVWVLVGACLVLGVRVTRPGNAARFQLSRAPYTASVFAPGLWWVAFGDGAVSPFDGPLAVARVPWGDFESYGPSTPASDALRRAARGRSVLFVVVDALRFDRVTRGDRFPALAGLWAQSVRFERAVVTAPDTRLSVSAMIQGRSSPSATHAPVLWERLDQAGYRTAMVAAPFVLERTRSRCDLGPVGDVRAVGRPSGGSGLERLERWDAALVDSALEWLDRAEGQRFALWVQLFAAHEWLAVAGSDPHERYDDALAVDDAALDRLLHALDGRGLRGETIVVLLSDHGEGLGDHGWLTHTHHVHPELIRVPMAFDVPGASAHAVGTFVSTVSLPATVLDLVGLEEPGSKEGASLLPLVGAGAVAGAPRPLLVRGIGHDAVLHGDWMLRFDTRFRAAQLIALEDLSAVTPPDHFDAEEATALRMFSLLYGGL